MKHIYNIITPLLLSFLLIGGSLSLKAQSPDAVFNDISTAIKAGDATTLSKYFNATVDVTLPDVDKNFSAQQASFVLKDFFTKHVVRSFQVMHKGNSGATHYVTGLCVTGKGEFDTNIFIKKVGDRYLVTQIRFEAD